MKSLLAILLFMLASITLQAQTTGTITGRIIDDAGEPVIGAVIRLTPRGGGVSKAPDGSFTIAGLVTGNTQVEISGIGYVAITQVIRVEPGQVTDLGTIELTERSPALSHGCGYRSSVLQPEKAGTVHIITREELWESR